MDQPIDQPMEQPMEQPMDQVTLNRALAAYLHGSELTPLGRTLYPLATCPPAAALADGYRALAQVEARPRRVRVQGFDESRHGRIGALATLRRRALRIARDFDLYLHGSFATLDFTGYSDIDMLAVIPATAACSAAALRRCRKQMVALQRAVRAFDPLQHHGCFVLTEIDLRAYPDPLYPALLLREAIALDGRSRELEVGALPDRSLAQSRFRDLAGRFVQTDLRRGLRSAYQLKSDLSVFMLLPALFWQARGIDVGKKESFQKTYPLLGRVSADAYRRAAEIREIWSYTEPALHRWVRRIWPNPLLPAALDTLRARPPARAVMSLLDEDFLRAAKRGVQELLEREESDVATRDPVA